MGVSARSSACRPHDALVVNSNILEQVILLDVLQVMRAGSSMCTASGPQLAPPADGLLGNSRVNQSFQLTDFLEQAGYRPKPVSGNAVVHGHCHQQALVGMKAPMNMLAAAGVHAELLDSGCCGMAGSFGFESSHYDISMQIGERTLLPKVRSSPEAIIVTDGFSCREQLAQATGRRALHTAELLSMGLPVTEPAPNHHATMNRKVRNAAIAAGLLVGLGIVAYRIFR